MLSDIRFGILGNQTLPTCHPLSPCSGIVVRQPDSALHQKDANKGPLCREGFLLLPCNN